MLDIGIQPARHQPPSAERTQRVAEQVQEAEARGAPRHERIEGDGDEKRVQPSTSEGHARAERPREDGRGAHLDVEG